MSQGGYVYIMTNRHHTTLYIGVTAFIEGRVAEHRGHLFPKSFTDRYNLEKLVYYEFYGGIEQAIAREKQLKRWTRKKKELLINSKNPVWGDLWETLWE